MTAKTQAATAATPAATVRIDSWVWAVRLAKTRSQATALCRGGHVKLNGVTVKAAQAVRIGDEVRVKTPSRECIYQVTGLATRRGAAAAAAANFNDLTPPPAPREMRPAHIVRAAGTGRPSKRERRELDRLRGRHSQ